jgi:magnesium transporter
VEGTLTLADGSSASATPQALRQAIDGGQFFWLNLDDVTDDDAAMLRDTFGFHPLAVEDAQHFGQRPKIEEYEGFTYFVIHGADGPASSDAVEVHAFYSPQRLVTVHHNCSEVFSEIRTRLSRHQPAHVSPPSIALLYLVADTLIDTYFPALSDLDDRIDQLEDAILQAPTEQQLGELFAMKRQLVSYRKSVTPQRDMFARLLGGVDVLPGMTDEDVRYFRDIYDHLIRISDLVDSYRDLVSGAVDTHLSTVSNRLNVVMKQLALIATIFLPLSFLTGFFGQNFGYLVNHVQNAQWAFWVFGLGIELLAVIGLMWLFRRRGWLGGPSA